MISNVIEVLKSSGPISVTELIDRGASSPQDLLADLRILEQEGLIDIRGPLRNLAEGEFTPAHAAAAAQTIVELSFRGFRKEMA
jgi:predicted transcriptional regulator